MQDDQRGIYRMPGLVVLGLALMISGGQCLMPNGSSTVGQACGGDTGLTCASGEFCKAGAGACDTATVAGVCTAIPDACIEVFDPVCGCDGETYSNECFADMAAVSVAREGSCE